MLSSNEVWPDFSAWNEAKAGDLKTLPQPVHLMDYKQSNEFVERGCQSYSSSMSLFSLELTFASPTLLTASSAACWPLLATKSASAASSSSSYYIRHKGMRI